jgi:site-specific recombinase XerD
MSSGNVERFIQQYADEVRALGIDIPMRVYPHMFRRTRATNLYQDGIELELISKVLGHSTTETTKIYAKPSLSQMRDALESVELPEQKAEAPLWEGNEDKMARLFGLR